MPQKRYAQVRLKGKTYDVKCTFLVIEKIESRPKGDGTLKLIELSNQLQTGDINISDFAWTIYAALSVNGVKKINYRQIGDDITEEGQETMQEAVTSVSNIVEACLGGAPEDFPEPELNADGEVVTEDETGKS